MSEANLNGSPPPLAGLKVFELSIAVAAPYCGRHLRHFGAEVYKVESRNNPDIVRAFGSAWCRGDAELMTIFGDTSTYVQEMNAGKKSVGLDLKNPEALAVAKRLIAQCDVFLTNYTTPSITELGLAYDQVREIHPGIIYCAMPGFGTDPSLPYHPFLAYGPNQAPLVGLDELTGYPGEEPAGIATIAPPDYNASLHTVIALLAALEHRDRTGEGAFIDVAQFETTVALLGPFLLEEQFCGQVVSRTGNRLAWSAPEGVYPCKGHERYVAISCRTDEEWGALGRVAGRPPWAGEPRFATLAGRLEHHDEIDEAIAAWTGAHTSSEIATWLQDAGVAAYPVCDNEMVVTDPQVRDRGFYLVRPSTRLGRDLITGLACRLTDPPGDPTWAGPGWGEHTDEVLTDVVGLAPAEIDALVEAGAAFRRVNPELTPKRPYDPYLPVLIPGLGDELYGGRS